MVPIAFHPVLQRMPTCQVEVAGFGIVPNLVAFSSLSQIHYQL